MTPTAATSPTIDLRVFRSLPGNMIVLLPDAPRFTIVAATDQYCKTAGTADADLIDKGVFEAFPPSPDDPEGMGIKKLRASLESVIRHKKADRMPPIRYDVQNEKGSFDERYWSTENRPVLDENGEVLYILHNTEEITSAIHAEQNRGRIERLQTANDLFLQAPVAIGLAKGKDYIIEVANEGLLEVWARKADEVLGKPLFEGVPDLDGQGYRELLDEVCRTGQPFYGYEHPVRLNRNGKEELLYFNFVYKPYYEPGQEKPAGVFTVGHNVTEQVLGKKKLEESDAHFRLLTNTVPAIIRITRNDASCSYLNKRWYDTTGQSEEEALGFGWLTALHPEDREQSRRTFLEANAKGEPFRLLYRLRQQDGTYRWSIDNGEPRLSSEGAFDGYIGSVVDVHEQWLLEEHMRRSEERYRHLFQNSPVAKWDEDFTAVKKRVDELRQAGVSDFTEYFHQHPDELLTLIDRVVINDVNEAALRMWGGSKEELLNGLQQFFIEDTLQTFIEEIGVIAAGGGRLETETIVQSKAGRKIDVLVRIDFPTGDDYGSVPVILVNITERKRAEEALRESENRFRTLAEALPQMVWMRNARGEIEFGSQHWEEYSGISGVSEAWRAMVHPDDWAPVMQAWERDSAKGQPYRYEVRLKNRAGEYRWHYASGEPIRDAEGGIVKWIGALTDIHAQKTFSEKLEQEVAERTRDLRNSESFLLQLIDSSVEYIAVLDKDLRFVTVNRGFEALMQTSRMELKNLSVFDVHPGIRDFVYHPSIRKALQGETIHLEKRNTIANPDQYIDSYFIPYVEQEAVNGVILMARDITEIVQTEKKLEQAVRELERSNEDLQQFAHVASHDLKEPVRKVMTFSNRLKFELGGNIPETAAGFLSKIESASIRMYSMIDGVLLYSSLNALEQTKEVIDLNELIQGIESDLEVLIQQKGAELRYADLPSIEGSAILIHQLFYNLLSNSLKFVRPEERPCIEIAAEPASADELASLPRKGEYIRITLSDNGIGFDQSNAEKIFQTFTRLNTKDKFEGTGLGLSLCRKIVERHGGLIRAEGSEGAGARFHILLPHKG